MRIDLAIVIVIIGFGTTSADVGHRTTTPAPRTLKSIAPSHDLVQSAASSEIVEAAAGDRIATIERGARCTVRVRGLADRGAVFEREFGCDVARLALSPDGAQLAVAGNTKLAILGVVSGKLARELELAAPPIDLAWGAAGLVAARGGEITLIDPSTGNAKSLGKGQSIAPSGDRFAAPTVIERGGEHPTADGKGHYWTVDRVAFEIVDVRTAKRFSLVTPELNGRVHFAAGGALVFRGLHAVYPFSAAGGPQPALEIGFVGSGDAAALSPDGRLFAVVDGNYQLRIYDLIDGAVIAEHPVGKAVRGLAFARDGKRLFGNVDGFVTWSLAKR